MPRLNQEVLQNLMSSSTLKSRILLQGSAQQHRFLHLRFHPEKTQRSGEKIVSQPLLAKHNRTVVPKETQPLPQQKELRLL